MSLSAEAIPSSSSGWRSRRPAGSTPPTPTGHCCPNSERHWDTSRPIAAGPCRDLFDGSRRDGFKPIHDLGGFLSGAATFDPAFFGISPREAVAMDPQQRVALRLAWRALENSGINPDDVAGHDVGCYVGASGLEYGPELSEFSNHSGHLITGTSLGVISGRHRLHPRPRRTRPDRGHLVLIGADGVPHRRTGDARRRLRPGTGRRRVRDGHPRILRRVLQAARAVRRRPLQALQCAGQRDGLGRGRGDVRVAAQVSRTQATADASSPRYAPPPSTRTAAPSG